MATLSRSAPNSPSRREEVERRVLEATEELLAEGASYTELSIGQIAERAGLKRSGFYFYFRDKRELLIRLTEDVAELLYDEADAWWSGAGDGPDSLQAALEKVVTLYKEQAVLLRAIVEASAYDETVAHFWRALLARFTEASRERIEAEQSAGRAAAVPAAETAFALTWMTERTCYQWLAQGGELDDPSLVEALVAIWTRAVYAPLG